MEGILSLKWNNHLSVLFHTLSSLYKKDLYSDVTLACGGRFFPVHKLVLSACSEFFEELFRQTPCTHPVVILKDVSVGDLEALLSYMYLGEANVAQSDLARLIKAAECLCIKGLAVPDEGGPEGASSGGKRRHPSPSEEATNAKRRKSDAPPSSTSNAASTTTTTSTSSSTPAAAADGEQRRSSSGGGGGVAAPSCPPHSSPREGDSGGEATPHATQSLAEVVLEDDEPIIKEEVEVHETKCEAEVEVEEVVVEDGGGGSDDVDCNDEAMSRVGGSSLSFTSPGLNSDDGAGDGGGDGGGGGGGVSLYDPQSQGITASHPNSTVLTDLMVSGMAGPSVAGDLSAWDSMGGFPLEGLQSEDSRSSQALKVVSVVSVGNKLFGERRKKMKRKRKRMRWWRKKPSSSAESSRYKVECASQQWSVKGMKLWRRTGQDSPPTSPSSPPFFKDYLGPGTGSGSPSVVEEAAAAAAVTLSCPYCQRTFTYRSDLNRHVRSHTGEKPYTCTHCDYRATQKTHLNEHIKRRHQHLI